MKREILIVLISLIVVYIGNFVLTGFLLVGESIGYKNWIFSNSSEYIYNSNLISLSENSLSLKQQIQINTYPNTSINNFNVTSALYDPDDKLDKIKNLDDNKFDLEKNNILDLVFGSNLDNGDNISVYIKSGSASNITLCSAGFYCTSPEYGNVSYSGIGEGYYNITIRNLGSPTAFFSIVSSKDVKIDHIQFNKGNLSGAYYNPSDKTDKISGLDSNKFEMVKNKLFNIFFDKNLDNTYTLNFYLDGNESSNISVCRLYDCSKIYGLIKYNGTTGWFSVNLSQMESSQKYFSLNSTVNLKIDYVNSTYTNTTFYNITNTTYPAYGFIQTQDLKIENLKSWDKFVFGDSKNGQNISYYYSTNSGLNWTSLSSDLSSISSKQIRIGMNLTSNGNQTGTIQFVFLNFTKSLPIINPGLYKKASPGDLINISFNITNPNLVSNAIAYIKYYNSTVFGYVKLDFDNSTNLFFGSWNSSGLRQGTYYIDIEVQSPYTKNLTQRQLLSLISSSTGSFLNSSLSFSKNETLRIDAKNSSNTILDIKTKENLENISLSIVEYTKNLKEPNFKKDLGKFVDIVPDSSLNGNLSSATIVIYYNETEIQQSGLDENTLKIHFFNETTNSWTELDSSLNKTEKSLTVEINHFSTYGVFGDSIAAASQSSGSSGGSGSSGSTPSNSKPVSIVIPITVFENKEEKTTNATIKENTTPAITCDYSASIDMEKRLVKNTGNCVIDKIEIEVSPNLNQFVYIFNSSIEKIGIGQTARFSFVSRGAVLMNSVTGLSVSSDLVYGGTIKFRIFKGEEVVKVFDHPLNIKAKKQKEFDSTYLLVIFAFASICILVVHYHRSSKA